MKCLTSPAGSTTGAGMACGSPTTTCQIPATKVNDGDSHEVWGLLSAVAVVTEQLRLGPLVAPTSVHHPALLANRAATIDHVSNGRFVLGLGAGWQINEHVAYGIELEAPKPRSTASKKQSTSSGHCSTSHAQPFKDLCTPSPTLPVNQNPCNNSYRYLSAPAEIACYASPHATPKSGIPGVTPTAPASASAQCTLPANVPAATQRPSTPQCRWPYTSAMTLRQTQRHRRSSRPPHHCRRSRRTHRDTQPILRPWL